MTPARAAVAQAVCIETGKRRVFASALDWPGWSRSGRDEQGALAALADYASRYAPVVEAASLSIGAIRNPRFSVIERLPGSATTDFGAPGAIAGSEAAPYSKREAERAARLVEACWEVLDRCAGQSSGDLRKGPRGGGRELEAIVTHALEAHLIYLRKLGLRLPSPVGDPAAIAHVRAETLKLLRDPARHVGTAWPARYGVRRIAWHLLDHAWEIEDRSSGAEA